MFVALVLLNFVHPEQVTRGKEGDMPGLRKRRRTGGVSMCGRSSCCNCRRYLSEGRPVGMMDIW